MRLYISQWILWIPDKTACWDFCYGILFLIPNSKNLKLLPWVIANYRLSKALVNWWLCDRCDVYEKTLTLYGYPLLLQVTTMSIFSSHKLKTLQTHIFYVWLRCVCFNKYNDFLTFNRKHSLKHLKVCIYGLYWNPMNIY